MTTTSAPLAITPAATAPRGWTRAAGIALSALPALFLAVDGIGKIVQPVEVVEGYAALGYPATVSTGLGALLLCCVALYVFPRTALLGAILLTGFLGGAVAVHVRVDNPLFTHTLFPTYLGILLWGGLLVREPRLRALWWR